MMGASGSSYGGMGNTGVIQSLDNHSICLGKLVTEPVN